MTTLDDAAFEIGKVEQVEENLYKIVGLAFKTLKVSDIVFYDESAQFEITKIFVFGRELTEIDRGFYIELFLQGADDEGLSNMKYLYLK